jgi:hypothetical protein
MAVNFDPDVPYIIGTISVDLAVPEPAAGYRTALNYEK